MSNQPDMWKIVTIWRSANASSFTTHHYESQDHMERDLARYMANMYANGTDIRRRPMWQLLQAMNKMHDRGDRIITKVRVFHLVEGLWCENLVEVNDPTFELVEISTMGGTS